MPQKLINQQEKQLDQRSNLAKAKISKTPVFIAGVFQLGSYMKKYQAIVKEAFSVFTDLSGKDTQGFTINSTATDALKLFVWLDYGDFRCAQSLDITLDDGTVFELSLKVAEWLRDTPWERIREKYAKWEELNSDL